MTVAHIHFVLRAIEDPIATAEKGYQCFRDIDVAILRVPGDKFFEYETEVTPEVQARWLDNLDTRYRIDAYKAWKNGQEAPLNGSPLKEWPVITPAELRQLELMHVFTVEDLAELSEEGMRRFGMGGQKLKQKAQTWIATGADKGKIVQKVEQQDAILMTLMSEMAEMRERLAEKDKLLAEKDSKEDKKGKLKLPEANQAA